MCPQLAPCLYRVLDHLTRKESYYYYVFIIIKKKKNENSASCVRVLLQTLNFVISRCTKNNARAESLFC